MTMKDYRSLIAPFLESIRTQKTTPETIRVYTNNLNECIDFLKQSGIDEPDDEYYRAFEASLCESLAKSTAGNRLSLARRFFTWTEKGQIPLTITENSSLGNEEATKIELTGEQEEKREDKPLHLTPIGRANVPTGRPRKSPEGRSKKITIYLTQALENDVKDLARIQRLSTPDFIFRLIERERDRRAEALSTFRALEEN